MVKNYQYYDRKASAIVTKLQNEIAKNGYYENIGQKELREFESLVNLSDLLYQEKYQLKQMLIQSIDNL